MGEMLPQLDSWDWEEVFEYANGKKEFPCNHPHGEPKNIIFDDTDTTPFDREDVAEIIAIAEGERDESAWLGLFKLKDGRFAVLRAWCDYTGWG